MKLKCRLLGHKIKESDIRYCNGDPNEEWRETECVVCGKTLQIENNGLCRDKFVFSPVDPAPGFIDDLIVLLMSGGYLMSGK